MLEKSDPKLALRLNPFNVDALVALSESMIGGTTKPSYLDQLRSVARRMMSVNPGDGRLYSVQALVEWKNGDLPAAQQAFASALELAPTERQALQWMIGYAADEDGEVPTVDLIDALFRRWPDMIPVYADRLSEILSKPEQRRLLMQHLERAPPWRGALISSLSKSPDGALFAADLLWGVAQGKGGQYAGEINQVLNALLAAGRYDEAYRTFLVTLDGERETLLGNVYNGLFSAIPSGAPFDWSVKRQPGLALSIAEEGTLARGLSLEFLDIPVRDPGVRQYLVLSPGRYQLSMKVSAKGAVLPKTLFWSIACFKPGKILAMLPVSEGTYPLKEVTADLEVPVDACGLQVLRLGTRTMTGSWNDRYSGRLHFDEIRIASVP